MWKVLYITHLCALFFCHWHLYYFQHYTKDEDGLCTKLVTPLTKKGNKFVSASVDDFKKGGWSIPYSELKFGEPIGKGEFGGRFVFKNKDAIKY